jgi:hypothetical protein
LAPTDWPLWWFAQLESAIERGDYVAAAEAQRRLEALGVTVTYRGLRPEMSKRLRTPPDGEEVSHD